jgi:hypothetical protein
MDTIVNLKEGTGQPCERRPLAADLGGGIP